MALISEVKIVPKAPAVTLSGGVPLSALVVDDDHCLLEVVHQMVEIARIQGRRGHRRYCGYAIPYPKPSTIWWLPTCKCQIWMDMPCPAGSKHKSKDTKVIVMTGSTLSNVVKYMKHRHGG